MAALIEAMVRDQMDTPDELEVELLLEALFRRFGYDFRAYEREALTGKLRALMEERALATVSQLQDRVLHDAATAAALLRAFSVQPAPLFCEPDQVDAMRRVLTSSLRASAVPKVWLAECAGAEEAWSLMILLAEQGMDERTEVFATVANEELLAEMQQASIPLARLGLCSDRYRVHGGTVALEEYFEIVGDRAVLRESLRKRIIWAQYNLVTDASFNEFQMIVCSRALADFGPMLRGRVLRLFHESLALFGVLGLDREFDSGDPLGALYQPVFAQKSWYKRIA